MVDLSELGPPGPWGALLAKWWRGELQRPDVVKLLRSREPIPESHLADVYDMLADVVEDKGRRGTGHAKTYAETATRIMQAGFVKDAVEQIEGYIKDTTTIPKDSDPAFIREIHNAARKAKQTRRGRPVTARQQAKQFVADFCGMPVSRVNREMTKARKIERARKKS